MRLELCVTILGIMEAEQPDWVHKALQLSFFSLFFLSPLILYFKNYELFEYPKMMFVYAMSIIILGLWLIKSIREKTFTFVRTPLDWPIVLYVLASVLATIFSIDPHTSIFGYYSRFNGGLLSIFAYFILYLAFVSEYGVLLYPKSKKNLSITNTSLFVYLRKFCYAVETASFLVAGYAILERLGIDKSFWVQDVQARVFSTLGQPNWLAAYLAMVIFINLAFLFSAGTQKAKLVQGSLFATNFLAFTFTYSRGGTLGLVAGLVVFFALSFRSVSRSRRLLLGLAAFVIIATILFGNALIRTGQFQGIVNQHFPPQIKPVSGSSLEGPTESSQIRLIVWKGAWAIFQHHPLLGTGVETFAYAYYQYRPAEHNQTSEWDFLYNKAHNEYLNELSTKGIVGFVAYIFLLGTMLLVPLKTYMANKTNKAMVRTEKALSALPYNSQLVVAGMLSALVSYLVQDFFGFSVVTINVLFFLFPAFIWLILAAANPKSSTRFIQPHYFKLRLAHQKYISLGAYIVVTFAVITYLFILARFWLADVDFAQGYNQALQGYAADAYTDMSNAISLNGSEPLYKSEFGYISSQLAVEAQAESKTDLQQSLAQDAENYTSAALSTSPRNITFIRQATRTYNSLGVLNQKYKSLALRYATLSVAYSPTDPSDYLRLADVNHELGNDQAAQTNYERAISLKPDYLDAVISYAHFLQNEAAANPNNAAANLTIAQQILASYQGRTSSNDAQIQLLMASIAAQQNMP